MATACSMYFLTQAQFRKLRKTFLAVTTEAALPKSPKLSLACSYVPP